jgi:hypothetical protein
MSFDALASLRQAGVITANTSPAALDVLSGLSEGEVKFLSSLGTRIKAAMAPEVLAHSEEGNEDTPCLIGMSCGGFGRELH